MRILWVKANKLLPVHSGGDIRSYYLAKQLAAQHELTFLSYHDGTVDSGYAEQLRKEFSGAVVICTGKSDSTGWKRGVDYLLRSPRSEPYSVSRLASSAVQRWIADGFQEQRFDLAVCDFLDAAANFPEALTVPSVLFQHNVESEIWRRHAATETNPLKRLMYRLESRKMLAYEQNTVRKFHAVIAVSQRDRELMTEWVDESRVAVVPTGVDLQQYRPGPLQASEPIVMYVGAMDWEPNVDAVVYFCREIWPAIVRTVPSARFRIVGRNPDSRVRKLASSSIEVTGRVPSVAEHLRGAAVVVVPLRVGGGTRLKIYEAMAAGKAVVSTSVGAEGLDVHHGRDIMLVDDAGSFAEAVALLLTDMKLRRRYEVAAAVLAAKYDWAEIGKGFGQSLESVIGTFSRAPQYIPAAEAR